jgi:DNA polymerase IV
MELRINPEPPEVMHIDLNSAFAMAEQQANPLLRGRPVGVTNRRNDYAICITASYEARRHGVGIGTRLGEARIRVPGFVMVESDPAKYHYVNGLMRGIFQSYAPTAYMKSVDEGVIDFRGMRTLLRGRTLEDIGLEIKQRVRDEVGDYMTVNVGIGQNHWLAKVAAAFMKPDGLYAIGPENIETVYSLLQLTDLPYIKEHNARRLRRADIATPLEFLRAPEWVLRRQVFQSIVGRQWYLKLRGYETEVEYGIRTVGRSYVLEHRTDDPEEIGALLLRACWKVARRLRRHNLAARGLWLQFGYARRPRATPVGSLHVSQRYGWTSWRGRKLYSTAVATGDELYRRAIELFLASPPGEVLTSLVITTYHLAPATSDQMTLQGFDNPRSAQLELAVNAINDRYGEFTIAPALAVKSLNLMPDKVPFGSVRYFD